MLLVELLAPVRILKAEINLTLLALAFGPHCNNLLPQLGMMEHKAFWLAFIGSNVISTFSAIDGLFNS